MVRRFDDAPCRKALIYGGLNQHLEELGIIDDGSKYEIPRAGHFAMHDQPNAFYQGLAAVVSGTD